MSHTNEREKRTQTPRTDDESDHASNVVLDNDLAIYKGEAVTPADYMVVPTSFARQLEMELNDISTELRQARAEVERLKRDGERLDQMGFILTGPWAAEWLNGEKNIRQAIDSAMAEEGGQE